jgi:manganese/zinc/iron transport system permease protein
VLEDLFSDYTLRTVALGAAVLGVVSGSLGTYAVLRRQSLLGDAISHAALPGIALAFLLTGSKTPLVLVAGAALAGWLGTLAIGAIIRSTRIKYDTALGVVLSVFFGLGLVLLTFIQRRPDAAQAGLDTYLFGQAAALLRRDIVTMAALGALALGVAVACWKELKLLSFDPDFGATLGLKMRAYDALLTGVLVIAIVIGLQTVGVVLMSAMLVAPAAAARQWTDRLGVMMIVAAVAGALGGVGGAVVSSSAERLPTGPTIVLFLSAIVVVSLVLAPRRGLAWRPVRARRGGREARLRARLEALAALAREHGHAEHGHDAAVVGLTAGEARLAARDLEELRRRGWARQLDGAGWVLTEQGRERVENETGRER